MYVCKAVFDIQPEVRPGVQTNLVCRYDARQECSPQAWCTISADTRKSAERMRDAKGVCRFRKSHGKYYRRSVSVARPPAHRPSRVLPPSFTV